MFLLETLNTKAIIGIDMAKKASKSIEEKIEDWAKQQVRVGEKSCLRRPKMSLIQMPAVTLSSNIQVN